MRYLLDSDSLSDLYTASSSGHRNISNRITALSDEDLVFVSILAVYELEYGRANAPEGKKPVIQQRIASIQTEFSVLPLTLEAAQVFGSLKAQLRTAGTDRHGCRESARFAANHREPSSVTSPRVHTHPLIHISSRPGGARA